jgi:hypothetical protein
MSVPFEGSRSSERSERIRFFGALFFQENRMQTEGKYWKGGYGAWMEKEGSEWRWRRGAQG